MKRFVTYLYAYRNGQKMKNTGHIRIDVRGQILDMRLSIKDTELDNEKGSFYIIIKKEAIDTISLAEISMRNGQYNGRLVFDSNEHGQYTVQLEDIIGVCVCYTNASYLASCWKDGEEAVIADGRFLRKSIIKDGIEEIAGGIQENIAGKERELIAKEAAETALITRKMTDEAEPLVIAAAMPKQENEFQEEAELHHQKINLSEIYKLPSRYWHFSNNSFLLHGFWNYGYLVVKEDAEKDKKRIALGVPGIFEQPEMVMATYFGFPEFEAMPSQIEEMEIGETVSCTSLKRNQSPQDGTFGCWFTNL